MVEKLKDVLKILSSDEDRLLEDIIKRGEEYINHMVGLKLDYEKAENELLLLEYGRYCYNNALEYFEENFKTVILRKQILEALNTRGNDA